MKNGDGVVGGQGCRRVPHGGQGGQDSWVTRSVRIKPPDLDWSGHGVCSLLPGGTVVGDIARRAVVVAAGGWDEKQPAGRGYKYARN